MSPLPQRRKSAEELAKLRDNLGIPAEAPAPFSAEHPSPLPLPPLRQAGKQAGPGGDPTGPPPSPPQAPPPPVRPAKAVRSLRRSERLPSPAAAAAPSPSTLPSYRHSSEELNEIRRLNAIHHLTPVPPDFRMAPASPLWLAPAYLAAFAGAAFAIPPVYRMLPYAMHPGGKGFTLMHPLSIVAGLEFLALGIATLVFFRRLYSRHHSAILAGIVFFTLIFAVLHFFPQFTHGS